MKVSNIRLFGSEGSQFVASVYKFARLFFENPQLLSHMYELLYMEG